jgi:hypothetical protein
METQWHHIIALCMGSSAFNALAWSLWPISVGLHCRHAVLAAPFHCQPGNSSPKRIPMPPAVLALRLDVHTPALRVGCPLPVAIGWWPSGFLAMLTVEAIRTHRPSLAEFALLDVSMYRLSVLYGGTSRIYQPIAVCLLYYWPTRFLNLSIDQTSNRLPWQRTAISVRIHLLYYFRMLRRLSACTVLAVMAVGRVTTGGIASNAHLRCLRSLSVVGERQCQTLSILTDFSRCHRSPRAWSPCVVICTTQRCPFATTPLSTGGGTADTGMQHTPALCSAQS